MQPCMLPAANVSASPLQKMQWIGDNVPSKNIDTARYENFDVPEKYLVLYLYVNRCYRYLLECVLIVNSFVFLSFSRSVHLGS